MSGNLQTEKQQNWDDRWQAALKELHAEMFSDDGQMRPEFREDVHCPVCASDASTRFCEKDFFDYRKCGSCGMVYMNPRLNGKATLSFYNSKANEIYNEQKFHGEPDGTSADDIINRENASLVAELIGEKGSPQPLKGKRILEIGCAKGYFLTCVKEMGAEAFGVELNAKSVEIARRSHGERIYDEDLFELNLPEAGFDVVYTRDVIEHIHDPAPFLAEIARLLRPGGMVFMATHNIDGLIHRAVGGRHTCIFGFEHPVHWSPKTLGLALERCGVKTRKVYFASVDFRVLTMINYFRRSTFTTIFPWRASKPVDLLLKLLSIPFRIPVLRCIDGWLLPPLANALGAGSTMRLVGFKSQEKA